MDQAVLQAPLRASPGTMMHTDRHGHLPASWTGAQGGCRAEAQLDRGLLRTWHLLVPTNDLRHQSCHPVNAVPPVPGNKVWWLYSSDTLGSLGVSVRGPGWARSICNHVAREQWTLKVQEPWGVLDPREPMANHSKSKKSHYLPL